MQVNLPTNDGGVIGLSIDRFFITLPDVPPTLITNTEVLTPNPVLTNDYYIPTTYTAITNFKSIYTGKQIIIYEDDNKKLVIASGFYKYPMMVNPSIRMQGYGVGVATNKPNKTTTTTHFGSEYVSPVMGDVVAVNVTAVELLTVEMGNPDLVRTSIINTLPGGKVSIQSTMPFIKITMAAPVDMSPYYIVPAYGTGHEFMEGNKTASDKIIIPVLL